MHDQSILSYGSYSKSHSGDPAMRESPESKTKMIFQITDNMPAGQAGRE